MNRVLNQIYAYCRSVIDATELHPAAGANPGARIVAAKVLGFLGGVAAEPSPDQLAALAEIAAVGQLQDLAASEPERLPSVSVMHLEPVSCSRMRPPNGPEPMACLRPSVSNLASVDSGED